jgi:uncharacterized protein
MTASMLRDRSCKDLAQLARSQGVAGWHSMRKEELVRALINHARRKPKNGAKGRNGAFGEDGFATSGKSNGHRSANSAAATAKLRELRETMTVGKQLASENSDSAARVEKDRLVIMVRDPYWLHAYWELAPRSVERAQSALGQHWHSTVPVLRVFQVSKDDSASMYREIAIHGGVNHWYVDVQNPPQKYRMEIGYRTVGGQFYCLARSNTVLTPPAGTSDSVDENWADIDQNADRIFAMSGGYSDRGTSLELQELLEERLRRPMGTPMQTRYGSGAARVGFEARELQFAVDAELIVYGVSDPQAHVTLQGEPVTLRPDGSFLVRMQLPDRRQVIPVIASSPDGVEQRTIILAVERNTKVLGPVMRDSGT